MAQSGGTLLRAADRRPASTRRAPLDQRSQGSHRRLHPTPEPGPEAVHLAQSSRPNPRFEARSCESIVDSVHSDGSAGSAHSIACWHSQFELLGAVPRLTGSLYGSDNCVAAKPALARLRGMRRSLPTQSLSYRMQLPEPVHSRGGNHFGSGGRSRSECPEPGSRCDRFPHRI